MSAFVRGALLTILLVAGVFVSLLGWAGYLQSLGVLQPSLPDWLVPYEQLVFVLVSAPVLIVSGAFAFWLYESRHRTKWLFSLAAIISGGLSYLAPVAILRNKPVLLIFYWSCVAALTAVLFLFGAWLAAKLIQKLSIKKLQSAA